MVREYTKIGNAPHIVYEIIDLDTGLIRVGRSSHSKDERFRWYLRNAFDPAKLQDLGNLHYEIAKTGNHENAKKRFKIFVRYVLLTKGESQIMEEFLTIFRNRTDEAPGYDLTINNEYNKIVGDLFRPGGFLREELNPLWQKVPPNRLADAVLKGLGMGGIITRFRVSAKTIRRRFAAYHYGVRGTYDLKDARAYLLKPIIKIGLKRAYSQEEFFNYCTSIDIEIFNRFEFKPNQENARGAFFRRMLDQIWYESKHKEVRYKMLAQYIISIIDRPDITVEEAYQKLRKIITFKYGREFDRICRQQFGMDFRSKRDEIFRSLIEELALKHWDKSKINLEIAIDAGLCNRDDPREIKERSAKWIYAYVIRNYDIATSRLPRYLNPSLPATRSLKDRVYIYMTNHPLARPLRVHSNFPDSSLKTIRNYVKNWKKNNRELIFQAVYSETARYIEELSLNRAFLDSAIDYLRHYIETNNPALNMEWRGFIAGAIYVTSIKQAINIHQETIASSLDVSTHTISKRYREIAESLDFVR